MALTEIFPRGGHIHVQRSDSLLINKSLLSLTRKQEKYGFFESFFFDSQYLQWRSPIYPISLSC